MPRRSGRDQEPRPFGAVAALLIGFPAAGAGAVTEDSDLVTIGIGENTLDFFATTLSTCMPIHLTARELPVQAAGPDRAA